MADDYSDLLEDAGTALFGRQWKLQMSELIGTNPIMIQRAMASPPQAQVTTEHRRAILKALRERQKRIDRLATRLASDLGWAS